MKIKNGILLGLLSPFYSLTRTLMPKKKEIVEEAQTVEIPEEILGSPLPVVFGTRYLSPKTAWWGNTKIIKISAQETGKKK